MWRTDDVCLLIFLNRDLRLRGGQWEAQRGVQGGRWDPVLPGLGPPSLRLLLPHRSCVSRRRLRLLRRAMRPLATFLRAGPTLMDVFSRAVVRSVILLPLCGVRQAGMAQG